MTAYAYPRRRRSGVSLGLLAVVWFVVAREIAARSATGFAAQAQGGILVSPLRSVFLLFLLLLGFMVLDALGGRRTSMRELLSLPSRATARREWGVGAALGWGAAVVAVLPLALGRGLDLQFWAAPRAWLVLLLSLAGALCGTFAIELTFRSYAFRNLRETLGPAWSTLLVSALYAAVVAFEQGGVTTVAVAFCLGLLLTAGWLRTYALWLPWGLHFAWNCALGALFGLPVLDGGDLASVVQTQALGRPRLSGYGLGPVGAPWTVCALLLCVGVLVWVTKEFAWAYTHPPIVPGGYPMDVPPPAAHQAGQAAAPPPPLVQILPLTPPGRPQERP